MFTSKEVPLLVLTHLFLQSVVVERLGSGF